MNPPLAMEGWAASFLDSITIIPVCSIKGDTGHSQSNMVTDLYAHTNCKDRQRLAMLVDQNFFGGAKSAPQPSTTLFSPEVVRIAEMLESQTDMATALLGMLQAMGALRQP